MTRSDILAPYACRPEDSRGRLVAEPESPTRSVFQRDRDRIIHSAAFRRLKYKTQVFVYHEGDHYRTRLTHSLEVAQIARSMARTLRLDEDLCEALALAHDLGHPPFGHAGEDALDRAMAAQGGFDHNDQTFRVLTRLEQRYADFDGLNLTWETLEGTVKHNGPLTGTGKPIPETIAAFQQGWDLGLASYASLEAQLTALSDDIAYNNHDIDDGLRAGLFTVADLAELPLVGPVLREVTDRYPGLQGPRLVHETIRRLIDRMVSDLLTETGARITDSGVRHVDEVRAYGASIVRFSDKMLANDRVLRDFLFTRMYRHYKVNRMASKARRVVGDLFELFTTEPNCLPTEWQTAIGDADPIGQARIVADYIAGMTDRFALDEHHRLFDTFSSAP
ncbi:MAG TPA: deoxyguanosinetriphosphate triphosphohydrolase [Stellaceae bacterium]|nr:deoxyguanosinetriphosphate triphosphohydrolase [Stellaceae bacterium]